MEDVLELEVKGLEVEGAGLGEEDEELELEIKLELELGVALEELILDELTGPGLDFPPPPPPQDAKDRINMKPRNPLKKY